MPSSPDPLHIDIQGRKNVEPRKEESNGDSTEQDLLEEIAPFHAAKAKMVQTRSTLGEEIERTGLWRERRRLGERLTFFEDTHNILLDQVHMLTTIQEVENWNRKVQSLSVNCLPSSETFFVSFKPSRTYLRRTMWIRLHRR